ncbi:MAG: hypothetical protein AAGC76_05385 [Luteibacter sp.]|uniref:hypothetical protein n=1 Tax=Luteibacter sp. TaxID=1886636 RepID=UPI00280757D2|nr:hypothetical protein [Luteibacter sp.]MDQ7995270.1 hypothetical protein [Luteibacter sp.]
MRTDRRTVSPKPAVAQYEHKYRYKYGSKYPPPVVEPSTECPAQPAGPDDPIPRSLAKQGLSLIVGFVTLTVALAAVYLYGADGALEPKRGPLWGLGEYLLPVLAAVTAGAGLYLRYPGAKPESGGKPETPDGDARGFFASSLVFLWMGIGCYVWGRVCARPASLVVLMAFALTLILVIRIRTHDERAAGNAVAKAVTLVATLLALGALGFLVAYWHVLFVEHMCMP